MPAISRVRNDPVPITLPVRTTLASFISGLTPKIYFRKNHNSSLKSISAKSAKSSNLIVHFRPDQTKSREPQIGTSKRWKRRCMWSFG